MGFIIYLYIYIYLSLLWLCLRYSLQHLTGDYPIVEYSIPGKSLGAG